MAARNDFVERIKEYRRLSREIREAEQAGIERALAEFDAALGGLHSFVAMDSVVLPVRVDDVSGSWEADGMDETGAAVTVVRKAGRLRVELRTTEEDLYISLALHPSKAQPVKKWVVETETCGHDGSHSKARGLFPTASSALNAVKTKMLGEILPLVSDGEIKTVPRLPTEDAEAADVVRSSIREAASAARELQARRKAHSHEIGRTGNAVRNVWDIAASKLGFLEGIDYTVREDASLEGSVAFRPSFGGGAIEIAHGEGFFSKISIEALDRDPTSVSFTVSDNEGRTELRCYMEAADAEKLAGEMVSAIMDEIEGFEAAYLPGKEPEMGSSMKF